MNRYRVIFLPVARRQADKLPMEVRNILRPHIRALSRNPRPEGYKKLSGKPDRYRIRVGNYRIIYRIEDAALVVLVVTIGDRKDVYR